MKSRMIVGTVSGEVFTGKVTDEPEEVVNDLKTVLAETVGYSGTRNLSLELDTGDWVCVPMGQVQYVKVAAERPF